jgi:hypothetical protein
MIKFNCAKVILSIELISNDENYSKFNISFTLNLKV